MMTSLLLTLVLVSVRSLKTNAGSILSSDNTYCQAETFEASCPADEVVLMTSALYGRMEVGRCVRTDYGYVGCSADVISVMDNFCSGRRSCEVRIPSVELDYTRSPCPDDFSTYLQADYACVPVHNPPCQPCGGYTEVLTSSREGYLSSLVTAEMGCGSEQCPYLIRAQPGQVLNITLLDFNMPATFTGNPQGLPDCMAYAQINEYIDETEREVTVCAGHGRETHVYTSETHQIRLKMMGQDLYGMVSHFMFKYTVLGCADYDTPRDTWVKRSGDVIQIGCVSTGDKWTLECVDGDWRGDIGDCPPNDSLK